jgi:hypothetical protein
MRDMEFLDILDTLRVLVERRVQSLHFPLGRAMDIPSLKKTKDIEFLDILCGRRVLVKGRLQSLHFPLGEA